MCFEVLCWCWISTGGPQIRSQPVQGSGWLLGRFGSGVRKRRKERLMASLKWGLFLYFPWPCLSGRGLLTDWWSPGTGKVISFKGLSADWFGVSCEGVTEWWSGRETTDRLWLASSNSSLIHGPVSRKSQEASCRWKGPNRLSAALFI